MYAIKDLSFRYSDTSFGPRAPEFTLQDGERVAFVSPSGSGKTTPLNLISGILTPQAGRTDVADLSNVARQQFRASMIGFVFQDFALPDHVSARQNILYPYRITPALTVSAKARDRAQALAASCGIGD